MRQERIKQVCSLNLKNSGLLATTKVCTEPGHSHRFVKLGLFCKDGSVNFAVPLSDVSTNPDIVNGQTRYSVFITIKVIGT